MRTTEEILNSVRNKIAVNPDAEALDRQTRITVLRSFWNAPLRHVKTRPMKDGQWGACLNEMSARLGTGFLVALIGIRGNGKTQLAVELMKHCTAQLRSAHFLSAIEFFMRIKATYGSQSKHDENEVLNELRKPSLLVIDECGKRSESEWENLLLFELINRRYNSEKDTLLIDNRGRHEFTKSIGQSLASRMNECGGIKECNWESFRQ